MKPNVTLLEEYQIFGENKLEIFKKMGTIATVTDHAILTGTDVSSFSINSSNERSGWWWTQTNADERLWTVGDYFSVYFSDWLGRRDRFNSNIFTYLIGVRPVLPYSCIKGTSLGKVRTVNEKGVEVVKYGYFPSYVPEDTGLQNTLTEKLHKGLLRRKTMTFATKLEKVTDNNNTTYELIESDVYEYDDKLYIRVESNSDRIEEKLSDGKTYRRGDLVWEEVSKIELLADEKKDILLSEKILFGGIPFSLNDSYEYYGAFSYAFMYKFLNECFANEIMQVPEDVISKYNIIFEDNTLVIEYFDIKDLDFDYIARLLISNSNINTINLKCRKFSFLKQKEEDALEVVFSNKILQKRKINYNISYTKKKDIILLENYEEKEKLSEIDELKKEINKICKSLPNKEANIITLALEEANKTYNEAIKKFKPEYGKDNASVTDYISLECNLISLLIKIKEMASSVLNTTIIKKEINSYRELLNNEYNALFKEKTIDSCIKNILYFSSYLDNTKKEEIKNKISSYLDNAVNKANDILSSILCDELPNEDIFFIIQELEKSLISLLEKSKELIKDTPKYKLQVLLNILDNTKVDFNDSDDDIINDIINIRKALGSLSDSKYKTNKREELNSIFSKHKDIISKSLEDITIEKYQKLVIDIIKDIHHVLSDINKYAKLDEYEISGTNIYRQLEISFELINKERIIEEESNNYKHNKILLEVINILKKIEVKEIDEEVYSKVNNDLNNILTAISNLLEVTDVSTKEKYNQFLAASCSLFNEVSSKIDRYIEEMKRYNNFFSSSSILKKERKEA